MPPIDGDPWRWAHLRPDILCGGGRTASISQIERHRALSRPHTQALSIRSDSPDGTDLEDGEQGRSLSLDRGEHPIHGSDPSAKLHVWAKRIEQRRGKKKSRVALARKLATVMLAMWKTGTSYEPLQVTEDLTTVAALEDLPGDAV